MHSSCTTHVVRPVCCTTLQYAKGLMGTLLDPPHGGCLVLMCTSECDIKWHLESTKHGNDLWEQVQCI